MSTPFSCFPYVQELLRILCCRVACFTDSLFRCSSFPTFQISLVYVPGTLDSSCQHVYDDGNVGGCFLGMLELGGFSLAWWAHVHSCPFTSLILRHGTDSLSFCPFVVVCLQYGERSRRDFH